MNMSRKDAPSEDSKVLLTSLRRAVSQALEKKKLLGQYAVVWRNGKPAMMGAERSTPDD